MQRHWRSRREPINFLPALLRDLPGNRLGQDDIRLGPLKPGDFTVAFHSPGDTFKIKTLQLHFLAADQPCPPPVAMNRLLHNTTNYPTDACQPSQALDRLRSCRNPIAQFVE
jgi:hypothetical protein